MDEPRDLERRITSLAALDQPLRRRLYRYLASIAGWTTRDEAAQALDVPRSVAAFHLDKLADAGVVDVRFERTSGRTGPGSGRPSKLYRPAQQEVAVSVPERRYDLAGSLLATAVADAVATGSPVEECLRNAARTAGQELGRDLAGAGAGAGTGADTGAGREGGDGEQAVLALLRDQGYEPEAVGANEIALTNCPFHRLAEEHRALVCGMNLDFVTGLLEGLGSGKGLTARLAPEPGSCCVRIAAA